MGLRICIILLLAVSCGQKAVDVSAQLKQAGEFQNKALKAYFEISQTYGEGDCPQVRTELDMWRNKMIDIPGVPHNHKYCNGKHHTSDIELSDAEMLSVQKEWHDSIFAKISLYQDCLNRK